MDSRRVGLGIVLVVVALLPGSAWAVTDEEIFRDFRFNFTNPGARALGLGGAFIAAADDATAAQANPAALHYVYYKEIFFEYRLITSDDQEIESSTDNDLTPVPNPDLFFTLTSVTHRENVSFPSFLAFALPFNMGPGRATFAFSRQVVLKTEATLGDDGDTALRVSGSGYPNWINDGSLNCASEDETGQFQRYSVCNTASGNLDADLVHYNLSFSYSLTRDFSIGVTGTYATLDVQSEVTNLTDDPLGVVDTSTNPRVPAPGGGLADIQERTTIDDSDSGTTFTVGLHWHPDLAYPSGLSPWRFGLVYRKGADMAVDQLRENIDPSGQVNVTTTVPVTLREPDRYGIGFAYDPIDGKWVYSLDIERVQYTDLLEGYESGVNFLTNKEKLQDLLPEFTFGEFRYTVDDATVLHAGIEYRLGKAWNWALRAGFYNAPDNRIRLEDVDVVAAPPDPDAEAQVESVFKDAFAGGDDVNHFTAGFSFQTPGNLTFQFAGDFATDETEVVMSAIWRFGKGRS